MTTDRYRQLCCAWFDKIVETAPQMTIKRAIELLQEIEENMPIMDQYKDHPGFYR